MVAGTAALGLSATDALVMAITSDASAVRTDARLGPFGKTAVVVASARGIAFVVDRTARAYAWDEVKRIRAGRGIIGVRTEQLQQRVVQTKTGSEVRRSMEKRTDRFAILVDDVAEPALAASFARVLEELRAGTFTQEGTAWHEHLNLVDRLQGEFSDQDDHVLPIATLGLWLALGLGSAILVAVLVNTTAARGVPAGAFSLTHRVNALDPRAIIAGLAFSALLTTIVLRLALGRQALVWLRGAARGWHAGRGRLRAFTVRTVGRVLLATSSSATMLLLALLSFWPNIAATVVVDRAGIRNEVLLPFISLDQPWSHVVEIRDATAEQRGVLFRFADGSELSTAGLELGGGTPLQLVEVSTRWRSAFVR